MELSKLEQINEELISAASLVADRYPAPSHCVATAEISFPGVPRSNLMNGNLVAQALLH